MQRLPNWVVGYHGCDADVGEAVLANPRKHLHISANDYDWLGSGIYLRENDPLRAMQWADEAKSNPKQAKGRIKTPFVVGAIIDLGLCLNLFDQVGLLELAAAYAELKDHLDQHGFTLPTNSAGGGMLRTLDQQVIEVAHGLRSRVHGVPQYQTVRAPFLEGAEIYPGASFKNKNHIQIAVRDQSMIKGYFRPRV